MSDGKQIEYQKFLSNKSTELVRPHAEYKFKKIDVACSGYNRRLLQGALYISKIFTLQKETIDIRSSGNEMKRSIFSLNLTLGEIGKYFFHLLLFLFNFNNSIAKP